MDIFLKTNSKYFKLKLKQMKRKLKHYVRIMEVSIYFPNLVNSIKIMGLENS